MLTHITPMHFIILKLKQSIAGDHCILMAGGGGGGALEKIPAGMHVLFLGLKFEKIVFWINQNDGSFWGLKNKHSRNLVDLNSFLC